MLGLDARADLRQQSGSPHGGVLAYAADNALTFAAGTVVGARPLTAGFTIDCLRPVDADGVATLCAVAQESIAVTEAPGAS
jgi:acyl-coenzyme A thioesterase PaaI-like protein